MKVNGEELGTLDVFHTMVTVPDCMVVASNKLGGGHGEAKLYMATKEYMYSFYGKEKFSAKCFMLKKDLISYLYAVKNEYFEPSQEYQQKEELPRLWHERMNMVENLPEVIFFTAKDQYQIRGTRGYINSSDEAYQVIRKLALPLISYIYVEKVGDEREPMFYWKLFVDFMTINEIKNGALVFKYGKKKDTPEEVKIKSDGKKEKEREEIRKARNGQGKYRDELRKQCVFCPFTMIADERLLIASHIKPWAAADDKEKVDPYNGYMLSPMFDKLFDRGFITFTSDRHVRLSQFLSRDTWKKIGLKDDTFIQALPMDEKREAYLKFHQENVFKGSLT